VTAGSFYQKTHLASVDLRSTTALQYVGALLVTLPVAFLLEPMKITWNTTMVLVLGWSVIALSLGAIGLMLLMIRRGAVSRVATLIYLIPPTVALEAWLLFGERLSLMQMAGMAVTVLGVALASRK
ncbi:MAG: EamA family transporter, partial [Bosea sp. (in: a-proteobacteria)]